MEQSKPPIDLMWEGMSVIGFVNDNVKGPEVWPFILNGFYDLQLSHAFYHTAHQKLAEEGVDVLADPEAKRGVDNTKEFIRNKILFALDPQAYRAKMIKEDKQRERDFIAQMEKQDRERRKNYRLQKEAEERVEKERIAKFNSQHAAAPEGTVKELAARYGKSIGEIRKLKAAGQLHTLAENA